MAGEFSQAIISRQLPIIGVIPAAGYAKRLQPLDRSKEVYPIGGRPVIDYLVERMRWVRCDQLRVVTRPEKQDVRTYAEARGAAVVGAYPGSVSESLLLGMSEAADDDVVLLGYPDSIWDPVDGYARILPLLDRWEVGLGLFKPASADLPRYETVRFDERSGKAHGIDFKVRDPSSDWIWGCAVAHVRALRGLAAYEEPGHYFHSLCAREVVGCLRLSDRYIDVGTPEGLRRATAQADGVRKEA